MDGLSQQASQPPPPSGVAAVISAVVNWLARTSPALVVRTVGRFLFGHSRPAFVVRLSPLRWMVPQRPALVASRVTFDLIHLSHAASAAQDAGGTGNWNTPANASGAPQGTRAGSSQYAGSLVLGAAKLRGTLVTQPSRGTLVIRAVYVRFHYETSGLPIVSDLLSSLILGYRINTAPLPTADVTLASVTANEDFLVAGREFRIDNGAGAFTDVLGTAVTWANLSLVQPFFGANTIANGVMAYYADAFRLRVVADTVYT